MLATNVSCDGKDSSYIVLHVTYALDCLLSGRRRGTAANVRMFDEVGPQFANNLVQEEGWTYVDGEIV